MTAMLAVSDGLLFLPLSPVSAQLSVDAHALYYYIFDNNYFIWQIKFGSRFFFFLFKFQFGRK